MDNLPKAIQPYAVVTTENGEKQAVKFRAKIKKRITVLTEELLVKNRNAQTIINENNAEYKPKIAKLKQWDKIIEDACKKFHTDKLASVATKKQELTVAQIEQDKIETSPIPETIIQSVPLPNKTVKTENGSMSYGETKKCVVVDYTKVPLYFEGQQILFIDSVLVNKLVLKQGKTIPGIEIYEDITTRLYGNSKG